MYEFIISPNPTKRKFMHIIREAFYVSSDHYVLKKMQLYGSLVHNPEDANDIDIATTWSDLCNFVNLMQVFFKTQSQPIRYVYGEIRASGDWVEDTKSYIENIQYNCNGFIAIRVWFGIEEFVKIDFLISISISVSVSVSVSNQNHPHDIKYTALVRNRFDLLNAHIRFTQPSTLNNSPPLPE